MRRRFMEDEPETLEEIGDDCGATRERIRELEQRARERLKRLATKHPTVVRLLRKAREQ